MDIKNKIAYNKNQASIYEWGPEWFEHHTFDEELISKIQEFQRENGLTDDGLCGPSTYRRKWTERQSLLDTSYINNIIDQKKYIIHNSQPIEINWDKVILWNDDGGLSCDKRGSFTNRAGQMDRNPNLFVTHWDVCLNSKSCVKVLRRRGLSIHFCIDNDGTIFQCLDTQHVAFHAGMYNKNSIGVEISTAYNLKYQNWYKRNGFGERPVMTDARVHGKKLKPFLGFYDVQLEALAALYDAISRACGIPLKSPPEKKSVSTDIYAGRFSGFCSHFHLTKKKIDCAGLDIDKVLERSKEIQNEEK